MTARTSTHKRKALDAGQGIEGEIRNPNHHEGIRTMTIIASRTDIRPAHLRTRRTAWWGIAVAIALVVVIAANPVVTDVAVWLAFAAATRVAVIDRRCARRAAHRAEVWQRIATAEAVEVGNAHAVIERVA